MLKTIEKDCYNRWKDGRISGEIYKKNQIEIL